MTDTRRTIRDELVQNLLQKLEKDLSDLPNLSDVRIRFIPRQALIDTISRQQVVRLLKSFSAEEIGENIPVDDFAQFISPSPEGCHCHRPGCTGARMILATLLLIGKETLITKLFASRNPPMCDQGLPFDAEPCSRVRTAEGDLEESNQSPPRSPTQLQFSRVNSAFFDYLNPSERSLFSYWQWQVMSPFLTLLGSEGNSDEEPDGASLPWQELTEVRKRGEGEMSYVQKLTIFSGNHNLSQNEDTLFALKTFDETLLHGLTSTRFEKELRANRNAPEHPRIVPVLAAFKHRRRCHLILPWADGGGLADGGSLLDVWANYCPPHAQSSCNLQAPTWDCSDSWFLDECQGIAEGLAATHGHVNHTQGVSIRQVHMDIKPENILCFSSDQAGSVKLTLKLADLGEAVRLDDGAEIPADHVPHTKTYRPPPESNLVGATAFKYDIWCLGCLYLDFITWFLLGWKAVEEFGKDREEEGDDPVIAEADGPEVIEDIFFKRVRQARIPNVWIGSGSKTAIKSGRHTRKSSMWVTSSLKIEYKVKQCVREQIELLKQHERCQSSAQLKEFIDYIGTKMLVVDIHGREDSQDVSEMLMRLRNDMGQ